MRVQGLPMTFFVDADGEVDHTRDGAVESADELADLLDEHLGVDAAWVTPP